MIVVEDIITDLVALLPIATFPNAVTKTISFSWGNEYDLNKYLKANIKQGNYPLIWLVTGNENDDRMANVITRKCRFVIAINSVRLSELNPLIWNTDYRITLNPVKDNLLTALDNSGITRIVNANTVTVRREPNYTSEKSANKTATIDLWNAIVIDLEVEFNARSTCFNTLQFNN